MRRGVVFLLAMLFLFGALPLSAATLPDTFVFAPANATASVEGAYPRLEQLTDGTMILVASGRLQRSKDNGASWQPAYSVAYNAAKSVVSSTGTVHALTCQNWQPYVLPDGTVFMAYRSRTKEYVKNSGKEFYTSIRVMKSTNGGITFVDEEILMEGISDNFYGFWEPIMIQIDERTMALYFADDLHVKESSSHQNINYVTYDIPSGTWDKTLRTAINGVARNSRDGMPGITKLQDGGFAMVVETRDYNKRIYNGKYYVCPNIIGLSLSKDGRTWSIPIPVAAPENLKGGYTCGAPFIATLPDGRVVITYHNSEDYVGERLPEDEHRAVFGAILSDEPLTTETELVPSTGGAAKGFTELEVFPPPEEREYNVWNSVYCNGEYVFFAAESRSNAHSRSTLRIRRAAVYATAMQMTVGKTAYTVNGEAKTMDVAPIIRGDRTMLPVRYIAEALGATVLWDGATSTATVKTADTEIRISVSADSATVNGERITLDTPAFIENDRAYMPVRFIAEALGATVSWDGTTSTATIRK